MDLLETISTKRIRVLKDQFGKDRNGGDGQWINRKRAAGGAVVLPTETGPAFSFMASLHRH